MWNKDHYIRIYRHKTLNVSNVVSAMGVIVGLFDFNNYKELFFKCFPFISLFLIFLLIISIIEKKLMKKIITIYQV